jgi:hypothetical protein
MVNGRADEYLRKESNPTQTVAQAITSVSGLQAVKQSKVHIHIESSQAECTTKCRADKQLQASSSLCFTIFVADAPVVLSFVEL